MKKLGDIVYIKKGESLALSERKIFLSFRDLMLEAKQNDKVSKTVEGDAELYNN